MYRLADAHAGLGAEAHGLVLALNLADSEGRVLVLPRRDAWCPPPPLLLPLPMSLLYSPARLLGHSRGEAVRRGAARARLGLARVGGR